MSPGEIRSAIVAERVAWIRNMIEGIRSMPPFERIITEGNQGKKEFVIPP
jgi:hypothetical protein